MRCPILIIYCVCFIRNRRKANFIILSKITIFWFSSVICSCRIKITFTKLICKLIIWNIGKFFYICASLNKVYSIYIDWFKSRYKRILRCSSYCCYSPISMQKGPFKFRCIDIINTTINKFLYSGLNALTVCKISRS